MSSENVDLPAHSRSVIRIFTGCFVCVDGGGGGGGGGGWRGGVYPRNQSLFVRAMKSLIRLGGCAG